MLVHYNSVYKETVKRARLQKLNMKFRLHMVDNGTFPYRMFPIENNLSCIYMLFTRSHGVIPILIKIILL